MYGKSKAKNDTGLIALAGASLLLTSFEIARRVIRYLHVFDPERDPVKSWCPEDYGIPRSAVEELDIETPDGQLLYGWYCRAPNPIASALYCHGNRGNITVFAEVIPYFLRCGISVLIFDYRGYGRSTGYATMAGSVVDAVAAARRHDQLRPRHLPSIAYGFSLGGPLAAEAATRVPFDALVLQSTFTNLRDMARLTFPSLPLHLLSGNPFDTVRALSSLEIPVMVIHGGNDEVCPPWMATALYDACRGPKEIVIIDGALHTNVQEISDERLSEAMLQFVQTLPGRDGRTTWQPADFESTWSQRTLRAMRMKLRRPRDSAPCSDSVSGR